MFGYKIVKEWNLIEKDETIKTLSSNIEDAKKAISNLLRVNNKLNDEIKKLNEKIVSLETETQVTTAKKTATKEEKAEKQKTIRRRKVTKKTDNE